MTELWGAETRKAIDNFPVSGRPIPVGVVRWLGRIKAAAARVNADLGLLDAELAARIATAGDAIAAGEHDDQFPIDVFQTGSGTSSNMNANEVIASLAGEGVHANDHVNLGQSSNDVFPSAVHLAALDAATNDLLPALGELEAALAAKAEAFAETVKAGRTHLMDAVPVTLGQEFGGYAAQIRLGRARIEDALPRLGQIPLGGTATGTGLNTHPEFAQRVRALLADASRLPVAAPLDHFEAQAQPRRADRDLGRAQGRRGLAHEDRERRPLDGLGPARRARRADPPGAAEGLLDHARQGQPRDLRGRHAGLRAGDRQRHGDHDRRHVGRIRAERLHPADGPQPARVDLAARRGQPPLRAQVHRRHRGRHRAQRGPRRGDARDGDRAQPLHRLRPRERDRARRDLERALAARGRARPRRRGVGARQGARPARHRARQHAPAEL